MNSPEPIGCILAVMSNKRQIVLFILLALLICVGIFALSQSLASIPSSNTQQHSDTSAQKVSSKNEVAKKKPTPAYLSPTSEFEARITKKKFGSYITPATSPVQPERFSGYHTGVDVEFTDTTKDVPVRAITNGIVTFSGFIGGYGGVILVTHKIENVSRTALYGHLDPASLKSAGEKVKKGQTIGNLGDGQTQEADGERKHLHFAILTNTRQDFRGYVQTKSELASWLDPLSLSYQ